MENNDSDNNSAIQLDDTAGESKRKELKQQRYNQIHPSWSLSTGRQLVGGYLARSV